MCELLGMSANTPTDLCFSFTGLTRRGGATGPHKDGWGVAFYEGKGVQAFHESTASASSEIAQVVQSHPIKSETAICHIRQANVGQVCLANTHPFTRELWGRHTTARSMVSVTTRAPINRWAIPTVKPFFAMY